MSHFLSDEADNQGINVFSDGHELIQGTRLFLTLLFLIFTPLNNGPTHSDL